MVTLKIEIDGELFGTIDVPEDRWGLSEYETYEQVYVSGHLTQAGRTGYSYGMWLERPLAKDRY